VPSGPSGDVIVPLGVKQLNQHHDEQPHISLTGFCSAAGYTAVRATVPEAGDT